MSATPTPTPVPFERDLELDLVPPRAVSAVLAAIAAVVVGATREALAAARAALALAIEPARAWPEGAERARARAALVAKRTEIEAAEALLDAAPTVAQPMPVIQASPPVPLASMVPTAPSAAPRVLRGQWARIRTGALSGQWGALVQNGVTNPQPGERIRVFRQDGTESPSQWVSEVVTDTARGVLVALTTEAPAPIAAAGTAPVAAPEVEIDWSEPTGATPATSATPSASALDASNTGTLEQALGAVAAQGDNIAASAAQGAAAHAARLGVGFSDPAQYLQALRNGGLQPHTRADYIARCKAAGLAFDESTLPPANAPTARTAIGAAFQINSTTHTPEGKAFHQMTPAERRALRKVGQETRAQVSKLLDESKLIAGAVAAGSMVQISWVGGGTTTVGKVRDMFAAKGLTYDAPTGPSAERHAGRAVDSLKNRGMDTARLPSNDLPDGIKARWLVGTKLTGKTIKAGDAYGNAALIVSLTDGGDLRFDGASDLKLACEAHYRNATQNEVLRSEDLTAWYAGQLRNTHYAVKRGHLWYVPAGEADAAVALSDALGELWGDHEHIPVTTGKDLARSLTRGLGDEVAALVKAFEHESKLATERAANKARKEAIEDARERSRRSVRSGGPALTEEALATLGEHAAKLAAERGASPSPTVAARMLTDLAGIAARVDGYRTVLGDESVATVRDAMIALRNKIEPLCTDGDMRASMLEFS